MDTYLKRYLTISFLNLSIVAGIGTVLRYKIAFSLPFVDQKFLLHGHSHFAFAGWVTQTLMTLMVQYLSVANQQNEFKRYHKYLICNLLTAYGMLFSFPVQGYGVVSITFSTLSVFVSYFFAVRYWIDLNKLPQKSIVHNWFKVALFLAVLSSVGTFSLAYMMANKIIHQNWYLAAIYFYLHFQYNGWFFFACMGLFYALLPQTLIQQKEFKNVFLLFTLSVGPAYFLSTLWAYIPTWLYIVIIIASIAQLIAWILLVNVLFKNKQQLLQNLSTQSKGLLLLSGIALTVKLILQLGSTIPSLSKLAFGFRPIVVAYLHLALLGVISLFLIGYIYASAKVKWSKIGVAGIIVFTVSVFLNEAVLMVQGLASFSYTVVPHTNEMLLFISFSIFMGVLLIILSRLRTQPSNNINDIV